jgi:hypothetical protein
MPLDREKYNNVDPISTPSISVDNGLIVGDTVSTSQITNGKILYSLNSRTYIPVGISAVVSNSVAYQATAPTNPSVGQIWIDSSSNNTSFDPNLIRRKTFTATGGQTAFIADYSFTDGYEQVYLNGLLLVRNSDYTTTNSIQVNLNVAAVVNDIVEIVAITNLNATGGAGALTTSNTFTGTQVFSPSNAAITPITVNGAFNQSADYLNINNYSGTNLFKMTASGNINLSSGQISTANDSSTLGLYANSLSSSSGTAVIAWGKNMATWGGDVHYLADSRGVSGMHRFWNWDGTNFLQRAQIDNTGSLSVGTTSATGKINSTTNTNYDLATNGAWTKAAISLTGSYGGTISFLDGVAGWNIRLQESGANIRFASGSTTSGLTDRFKIRNDNVIETYGTIYSARGSGATNVALNADGTGMGASSYNYVINGSNETGANALVVFVNGSSRTADNGVNSVTIRNDIANLYLGRSGATTYIYSYTAASDRNLKENIVDYSGGIDIIKSLNPKQFNFIDNPRTQYGFIAQEVTNDKIVIEGKNGEPWGVDYNAVVSALTLAVQELTARIESLEDK